MHYLNLLIIFASIIFYKDDFAYYLRKINIKFNAFF